MNTYVKNITFFFISISIVGLLALISACNSEGRGGAATFSAEFVKFSARFPELKLPLTIDEEFKMPQEAENIPNEELIRFIGAKEIDPELGMVNIAGTAVGRFAVNDSITALLYHALDLPVGSGESTSYNLIMVDATGLERARQTIAAFNGWDGGYHGQSCTISADRTISALSESEYTNGEGEDVVSERKKYEMSFRPDGTMEVRKEVLFSEEDLKAAQPFELTEITSSNIPDIIKKDYVGQLAKSLMWQDTLGKNYLVFSTKEIATPGGDEEEMDYYLYGTHYVDVGEKFPNVLWKTQDFEKGCMFDNMLSLVEESIRITDLDGDRVAETSYMYTTGCVSDVSPYPLKLIMHEGEKKMAVRGTVRLAYFEENPDLQLGTAEYEVDEETFDGQPSSFRDFAIQLWGKHDLVR